MSHNSDVAKVIQPYLGVSLKSVYKRLRGDIPLTTAEIETLAVNFNISLDAYVLKGKGMVPVWLSSDIFTQPHPLDFLRKIEGTLQKVVSLPDVQLWYASTEMPFFQYMRYRNSWPSNSTCGTGQPGKCRNLSTPILTTRYFPTQKHKPAAAPFWSCTPLFLPKNSGCPRYWTIP